MRTGLISYDGLPVGSGGGHGLGRLAARDAWSATQAFLRACTTAGTPTQLTLTLNSVEDDAPAVVDRCRTSAVAALDLHPSPHESRDYGGKGTGLIWKLAVDQADAAIAWREALGPLPSNWLGGPAVLAIDFQLRFRAATGEQELPYQEPACYLGQPYDGYGTRLGESRCRLTVSSRSSLSVIFFLPFEAPGPELWSYVAFLQSRLPFKFSSRHWRHWRLTKNAAAFVASNIKNPVLGSQAAD